MTSEDRAEIRRWKRRPWLHPTNRQRGERMKKKIDRCPHCGGTDGIFRKMTLRNVRHFCGFNGEEQDNSEMYDDAVSLGGEMAYCQECLKPICRISTLRAQWEAQDESP